MFSQNYPASDITFKIGTPCVVGLSYIQAAQDPNWSFHLHAHEETLEISYVLSGKGVIYCDGRVYEVAGGDIVIKNPGVKHAEKTDFENPLEQVCVNIDGFQVSGAEKNVIPQVHSPIIKAGETQAFFDAAFREMVRKAMDGQSQSDKKKNQEYLNIILQSVLAIICFEMKKTKDQSANNEHWRLMSNIQQYINLHFNENPSLEDIADKFHISVFYLSRQFKKCTGYTVNQYITSCKMGEAQRLMLFKGETIENVSKRCGYDNLSYFYTVFRKNIGCTPREYLRRYQ